MTTEARLSKHKKPRYQGKNEYGLDMRVFEKKMTELVVDLEHYTPAEIYRELTKLAEVAKKQINP